MAAAIRRAVGVVTSLRTMLSLQMRNLCNRSSVVDAQGNTPVVALTTHGRRLEFAHLAIESIGRGDVLPSRLVLWLDPDDDRIHTPPRAIARLRRRGLEIRRTSASFGPHAKYYPQVGLDTTTAWSLVTSDDDVMHPRNWLRTLVEAAHRSPDTIIAHRAHAVAMTESGRIAPYAEWTRAVPGLRTPRTFGLGVGGVLYPPLFLDLIRQRGPGFLGCAPRADDVWLHFLAVASETPVLALGLLRDEDAVPIRGHRTGGLWRENVDGSANDRQIEATYTRAAIEALISGGISSHVKY